jgi:nucleotide-binding universal stress UspA family protein
VSKPIVAGYDPRTSDRAPVDFAITVARFTGARLLVASVQAGPPVIPIPATPLPAAVPSGQIDEDLVGDCTRTVEELERELGAAGVQAECRKLQSTSAARALHELAEDEEAGLLVVGSSREGAAGRILMGSTATRLVHGAPCPVAVVPRRWEARPAFSTVGVAYVDSEEAREALHAAQALARRVGAKLRVLTVVKVDPVLNPETEPGTDVRPGKDLTSVEGEERVRAERSLRDAVAGLGRDVEVEVDAFVGEPAEVLIDLSQSLDVLVCGSRGYGPIRSVMLGSVSRRVANEAHCPVIVVPRGVKTSLEDLVQQPAAATTGP